MVVAEKCQNSNNLLEGVTVETNTDKLVKQREFTFLYLFFFFCRITVWRPRIWRRSLISLVRQRRTCRISSQAGGAAVSTMGEPLESCPMTSSPPWWTSSLLPRASLRGSTGEICQRMAAVRISSMLRNICKHLHTYVKGDKTLKTTWIICQRSFIQSSQA